MIPGAEEKTIPPALTVSLFTRAWATPGIMMKPSPTYIGSDGIVPSDDHRGGEIKEALWHHREPDKSLCVCVRG